MSDVWVPPPVSAELQEESRRRETEALKGLAGEETHRWVQEFNAQLERVVHGMKLMWCHDPAPVDAVAQGARPGFWHLVWPGYSGGPLNVLPLEGPDGEWREPGSWVFDMLARSDMWNDRAMRERRRIREEAEEAKARRKERERAALDQDMLERYLAVSRTQVSMNKSTPWAQNSAGYRRTRGRKK